MASRVASSVGKNNSGAASVLSLTVTLGVTPTVGNYIAVAVSGASTASVPGCPFSASCTGVEFFAPINATQGATNMSAALLIGRVLGSPGTVITVNQITSAGMALVAAEYTGVGALDRQSSATGSSTSPASGATGTTTGVLWLAAIGIRVVSGTTFSSPTNSFAIVDQDKTSIASGSDRTVCLLERFVAGTNNAGATAATGIWVAQLATFDAPASGGTRSYAFIG
jgi:hypothetical protein